MKKLKLLALGTVMCLSLSMLTGCGNKDNDNNADTTDNADDRNDNDDDMDVKSTGTNKSTDEPSGTGNVGSDIVDTVDDVGTDIVDGVTDIGDDLTGNDGADRATASPDGNGATTATAQP